LKFRRRFPALPHTSLTRRGQVRDIELVLSRAFLVYTASCNHLPQVGVFVLWRSRGFVCSDIPACKKFAKGLVSGRRGTSYATGNKNTPRLRPIHRWGHGTDCLPLGPQTGKVGERPSSSLSCRGGGREPATQLAHRAGPLGQRFIPLKRLNLQGGKIRGARYGFPTGSVGGQWG